MLRLSAETQCPFDRGFFRRFPSGEIADSEYRVRSGELFIITDYRWQVLPPPATFVNGGTLETTIDAHLNTDNRNEAFTSSAINLTPELAAMDRIAGTDHMTAGRQIGSGRFLCPNAFSKNSFFTGFHRVVDAEIDGYVIKK